MINESIKSFFKNLDDKTSSPLFGAFIVSWVLWNHKYLMAIVAGGDLNYRFEIMNKIICEQLWYDRIGISGQWLVLPLITAFGYIVLYPLPALGAYYVTKYFQIVLNRIKNSLEQKQLIPREKSNKLYEQIRNLEKQYNSEIDDNNTEISTLKALLDEKESTVFKQQQQINKLNEEIANLKNNQTFLKPMGMDNHTTSNVDTDDELDKIEENSADISNKTTLNKDHLRLLVFIGDKGMVNIDNIVPIFKDLGRVRCIHILNQLVATDYLTMSSTGYYKLTTEGTSFLVDNDLV